METAESEEPLLSQDQPGRSSTEDMYKVLKMARRDAFLVILQILNLCIFLSAIALLTYSAVSILFHRDLKSNTTQVYVSKPGPNAYYSHFSSLYLSACLAFETLQIRRLMIERWCGQQRWMRRARSGYLILVTLSGLVDGVAFSFTPKPDTTAIAFLAFIDGSIGIIQIKLANEEINQKATQRSPGHQSDENVQSSAAAESASHRLFESEYCETSNSETVMESAKHNLRSRRFCRGFLKISNRVLMAIHVLIVVISTSGAIELALLYRYENP